MQITFDYLPSVLAILIRIRVGKEFKVYTPPLFSLRNNGYDTLKHIADSASTYFDEEISLKVLINKFIHYIMELSI